MSSVLEKARIRIAELRAELLRLEEFLRTYEELEKKSAPVSREFFRERRLFHPVPVNESIADAAVAIIRESKKPVPTPDLVVAIEKRGIPIGGIDKIRNASSIFSRDKRLVNYRGMGWMLAEQVAYTLQRSISDDPHDDEIEILISNPPK